MRIKLTKLREADNPEYPNNIPTGNFYIGFPANQVEVGECFYLKHENRPGYLRTSIVQEVIDEHTFRTCNSIYQMEELDD